MHIHKKIISKLDKCYSIAPLTYNGKEYFMVAAEKVDRCILFDLDGNEVDTIWEKPGGAMSMVQVPESNGQFLAIHKFYSPNNSADAEIVIVTPDTEGSWNVQILAELPHIHRLDIIQHKGVNYLIACTLKSGHEYKEDWTKPGKVYSAVLPADLSGYNKEHQLKLTVLKDNMLKNHGYYRVDENGINTAVISAECGVFQFFPPDNSKQKWIIKTLLETPASDAVLLDMDNDGKKELIVMAPFHGNRISIYKREKENYKKIYEYEKETDFLHAIYGGELCGRPALVIGYRKAERNLVIFIFDETTKSYQVNVIDENCGPANVFHYKNKGKDIIISANREIHEIAMYTLWN